MVSVSAGPKIKEALSREPHLTIGQVAQLFYSIKKDGTPAARTVVKPRNKEYILPRGYWSAKDMLGRMAKRGELIKHTPPPELSRQVILFTLPGRKPPSKQNWDHETTCADLFVAFERTGKLLSWDAGWEPEEYALFGQKYGILYDRRMELDGVDQAFFWEVDKGTEIRETLLNKIQKYVRLSNALPHERFTVIFTVQSSKWTNADNRRDYLLSEFARLKRGHQFLVAAEAEVMADPLGNVFHTPAPPASPISLLSL